MARFTFEIPDSELSSFALAGEDRPPVNILGMGNATAREACIHGLRQILGDTQAGAGKDAKAAEAAAKRLEDTRARIAADTWRRGASVGGSLAATMRAVLREPATRKGAKKAYKADVVKGDADVKALRAFAETHFGKGAGAALEAEAKRRLAARTAGFTFGADVPEPTV